jgi:signal transduction histidine kinase/DNA-binding response OmpR family regulator/ligand-binding sensor domain-containing protein
MRSGMGWPKYLKKTIHVIRQSTVFLRRVKNIMLRILFLLLLFGAVNLQAQTPAVEEISIEQGLSQGFISDICQDSEGFMWFGTNSGLNRYDGYEFLVFKNDPYDPFSLPDNKVMAICEAGDFLFWISHSGAGLLHRRTRRFYSIAQARQIPLYQVAKCRAENAHTVWLSLYQEGSWRLYRCSWPKDAAARLPQEPFFSKEVRFERMYDDRVLTDFDLSADRKTLWLAASGNQVFRKRLPTGPLEPVQMAVPRLEGSSLLALGNDAVGVLDGRDRTFVQLAPARVESGAAPQSIPAAPGPRMRMLNFDVQRQLLWVGRHREAWGFDMRVLPDSISRAKALYVLPLPEDAICGYTDSNGIVWIGTDAKGILKFNPHTRLFKNYCAGQSVFCPPLADRQGNIWISNLGNRQFNQVLNPATGLVRPYPIPELAAGKYESRGVVAPGGTLWLTAVDSDRLPPQLIHYDPQTGEREVFRYPLPFYDALPVLFFDAEKQIVWTAYSKKLIRFDVRSRAFSVLELEALPDRLPWIHACAKTADGSLWLAYDVGLLRAKPGDGAFSFQLYRNDPSNRNSLAGNYVKSLLVDPLDGMVLWIGTAGYGLCRYDLRAQRFSHYNTRNGLSDDVVYGIVADTTGRAPEATNLWLSTNKGLTRFNPAQETFRYFVKADGLQDNEFNTFASGAAPSGELMFGGVNGLTVFHPDALRQVSSLPAKALLTQLRVNTRLLEPGTPDGLLGAGIEFSTSVTLAHDQNNLYLQFMATDMVQPKRNMFSYYLEGAESEWAHTGFGNSAQYLNLAPGSYRFVVKAANGEGIWNETPTVLNIRIRPPWYAAWWAYTVYAALLGAAVWWLYRFQLRRKLEQAETRRLKELDTLKSRLFTNITHEFRTPLTVILGMADQVKKNFYAAAADALEHNVEMMKRNGQQLLKLINQMLDLAKLESGNMQLHLVQDDVAAFVKYIVESNQSYSGDKNVHIRFECDTGLLLMDFDREKLQALVSNLLSNAVKFSHPGGEVSVKLGQTLAAGVPCMELSVQDHGIGIPEAQLKHVFDRFYQADNSDTRTGEGTGIGLALVQELVKLMDGSIQVESREDMGTRFELRLPIRNEAARDVAVFGAPESPASDRAAIPIPGTADADAPVLLLVEDNEDVRRYIVVCLSEQYRILEARNGLEGIEMALEHTPDLIVSDVMMPEKSGLELCETLKNDACTSHIPIVLLTAKTSIENRIAGLSRGADAYLAKPFHREELLLTVANLLQSRRAMQERLLATLREDQRGKTQPAAEIVAQDAEALAVLKVEHAFVQNLRRCVEEHISNSELSMDVLSRAMTMSYQNLHLKLKALTGLSPVQFIRLIRLQKAKTLLQSTRLSITDIAHEAGFADPKYFSRVFTEEFGMPPSSMREQPLNQQN